MNITEAIELTRAFMGDAQDIHPNHPDFDFYMSTVARNISMQSEHLENISRALVTETEQLTIDIKQKLT